MDTVDGKKEHRDVCTDTFKQEDLALGFPPLLALLKPANLKCMGIPYLEHLWERHSEIKFLYSRNSWKTVHVFVVHTKNIL
jgi:hypothetical protein